MSESDFTILEEPSYIVAPRLLGSLLVRELDGQRLVGKIVETEAYDQTDVASHSYRGETQRTRVMFGPAGHLYVYFTYGMHYCCNIVTGPAGQGAAVLIRALEPLKGETVMRHNRGGVPPANKAQATNGPAKLCRALVIDKTLNGHNLQWPPLRLVVQPPLPPEQIATSSRIGISQGQETQWRFYDSRSLYVSKHLRHTARDEEV